MPRHPGGASSGGIFRVIIPFGRCDYDLDSLRRKWSGGGDGDGGALIESQHFLSPPDEPKFDLY